jgi:hypothetical protein
MKTLLIPAIAAIFLLPFHSADAQGKTFGGFKSNYKFSFKVEEIVSAEVGLTGANTNAPIPKGVPKYKKGQTVKFKIGRKGELIAVGTKIPFAADAGTSNVYSKVTTGKLPKSDAATVFKDANSKATSVALNFTRVKGIGLSTKTYNLTYTLR